MKKIIWLFLLVSLFMITSCKKKDEDAKKEYSLTYKYLNETETVKYIEGTMVNLKTSKDLKLGDKEFVGWYLNSDYSGEKVERIEMKNDCTVYGLTKDKEITYIVDMNIQGEFKPVTVVKGTKIKDLTIPLVEGYEFVNWSSSDPINEVVVIDGEMEINEDLIIWGIYKEQSFTVTFDSLGAQAIKSQKVGYNGTIKRTERPCKLYYSFKYWSLDKDSDVEFDYNTLITQDLTLYACYESVSYDHILDECVPDEIEDDLDIPYDDNNVEYIWKSSDPNLVTGNGTYSPKRTDEEVTITLEIVSKGLGDSVTYSKKALVKGYSLKPLVPNDVIIGYTSSWYYRGYSEEVLKTVDVLDISFAYVYDDGTLNISDIGTLLTKGVGIAHKNGVRMCLSIQGYAEGTKNFSDCAADVTLRGKLADSMVEMVDKYHLDGIDIDWEYPGSYSGRQLTEDRANYTLLMKEIRERLDRLGSGYLLTAAIPAGNWGAGNFEMDKLDAYFDYYNMMSYDLENPKAGTHHCALYPSSITNGTASGCSVDETVTLWTNKGVKKEKICLGIAFYGKSITVNSTLNNGLGQPASTQVSSKYVNIAYAKLMDTRLEKLGSTYQYYFDKASCAPYQFATATKYFTTYDNELSVLYKTDYAKKQGLGGVMIWEIGEDSSNTLIQAVYQGMNKPNVEEYIIGTEIKVDLSKGNILVKTVNEVINSSLKNDLLYYVDDNTIADIVQTTNGIATLQLKKAGTVNVYASTNDKSTIYGEMKVTIS